MNIHFIICNYNAELKNGSLRKSLERLKSIKREGVYFHEIDNASKDDSRSVLAEYSLNGVLDNVVLLNLNKGKAFALNRLYEFILKIYNIADDDIIVSMDSDILIQEDNFIEFIRNVFNHSNAGYIGYNMFDDEDCTCVSEYTKQSVYKNSRIICGRNYMIIDKQSGLAGGILVIKNNLYKNIRYNECLGKNRTAAVYGGDDAVLTLCLFRSGIPGVYDVESRIVHTPHDSEYKKWKDDTMQTMILKGFGNSDIPDRGFYD